MWSREEKSKIWWKLLEYVQNKWKHIEISCNLQMTISFDWNEIFSICKNLKSSDFYGEYFRKTFKHIFHTFGVSSKPKRKKIRNFWPKILFRNEIFSNRGLLWLYGVWQNKAQRVPEHLQRVSLLDKFVIIIGVKGRCAVYARPLPLTIISFYMWW